MKLFSHIAQALTQTYLKALTEQLEIQRRTRGPAAKDFPSQSPDLNPVEALWNTVRSSQYNMGHQVWLTLGKTMSVWVHAAVIKAKRGRDQILQFSKMMKLLLVMKK